MTMRLKFSVLLPASLLLGPVLAGCAEHKDRRLADDQQTCQAMGHPTGSDAFKQCLAELNQRRCAMVRQGRTGGVRHQETEYCSRLP